MTEGDIKKKKNIIWVIIILSSIIISIILLVSLNVKMVSNINTIYKKLLPKSIEKTENLIFNITNGSYIIDENTVYINDGKVFISATPHTLYSNGWVYFDIKSKVYSGDVDLILGVDTEYLKPKQIQYYNPVNISIEKSITCNGDYFNYTLSPNHVWCYKEGIINNQTNETGLIYLWDRDFEYGNLTEKRIYWHKNKTVYWHDFDYNINHIDYEYQGMNKWYYSKNISINQDQLYKLRVFMETKVNDGYRKYWFGIKPSTETLQESIASEHLYVLDPWGNSSYSRRVEINISGSNETLINFTKLINVTYDSNMQSDFGDLLFYEGNCSSGGTTQLYHEINSKTDSSSALVWVRLETLNPGDYNTSICMYYGNAGANNNWKTETWDNNYLGVWHLEESDFPYIDSTGNFNFTEGTTPSQNSTCTFGKCQWFDASTLYMKAVADGYYEPGTKDIHIEHWIYPNSIAGETVSLCSHTADGDGGWAMDIGNNIAYYNCNGGWSDCTPSIPSIASANNWYYVDSYKNGTDYFACTDGSCGASEGGYHQDSLQAENLTVGAKTDGTVFQYDGNIDEFRISNITRSRSWINATYENTNMTSFIFGSEESESTIEIGLDMLYPTENINVTSNQFFNISVNISCISGTCGTINVSFDPVIFVDNFTDTVGTYLYNHNPDTGDGWTRNWTAGGELFITNENTLNHDGGSSDGGMAFANPQPYSADYNVTSHYNYEDSVDDSVTLFVRYLNNYEYYAFTWSTTISGLYYYNTVINSSCSYPSVNDWVTLSANDNEIAVYINGVKDCFVTDSNITDIGFGGVGVGAISGNTDDDTGNQRLDDFYIEEESPEDSVYPIFSDYDDNNGTLYNFGWAEFNVTVTDTNGTVWLEIDGNNYTAINSSGDTYNYTLWIVGSGDYNYLWHSWGNGTNNNYNVSNQQSYTISSKGLISTSEGDTPFYTNSTTNPITTTSLSEGESEVVTIWVNATGTINTTYEFFVYANTTSDLSISNISNVWNTTITDAIAGDISPTSILSSPANATNYTNGTVVTFECNATDDYMLENVTLYIWNSTESNIHTNSTTWIGTSNSTTFDYNLTYDDIFDWNCLVYDNASQSDWFTNNWTVNITSSQAPDTEYPIFSNNGVNVTNNTEYIEGRYIKFNITITSTNGTAGIEFNGVNYSLSNTSTEFYTTLGEYSAGSYNYYYWAYGNGSENNYNTSDTYGYTIAKNSSLILGISRTSPIEYEETTDVSGSGCPSQLTGSCSMDKSNGVYGAGVETFNYSTAGNTNYTATSITTDITINQNSSYVITASGTSPIEYEETTDVSGSGCPSQLSGSCSMDKSNGVYGAGVETFNYSTAGNNNYTAKSDTIDITINQNSSYWLGITGTSPITYGTSTDVAGSRCPSQLSGSCNLDKSNGVYGVGTETFNYSTAGNNNYTAYSNTTDIIINNNTEGCDIYFNETSPLTFPKSFTVYTNCSSAYTLKRDGSSISNASTQSLGAGTYNFTVERTDNQNYTNTYDEELFTINQATGLAYLYINGTRADLSSYNDTTTGLSGIWINATIETGELSTIELWRNGSLFQNGTAPSINNSELPIGYYNFTAKLSSSQNYTGDTETWWVNITEGIPAPDTEAPYFTFIPDAMSLDYNTYTGVNFTATDDVLFDSYAVNDSRFIINDSGWLFNNSLFNAGNYYINISINDSSGNMNSTIYNINWTQATPEGSLNNHTPTTLTYNESFNFTTTENNIGDGDLNYKIYRNNIDVTSEEGLSTILGSGTYNYIYNVTGGTNYTSNSSLDTLTVTVNNNTGNCDVLFNETSPLTFGDSFIIYTNCNSDFTLKRDGTTISNGSTQTLGAGTYNFTVERTDNQNYTNIYDEELFTINQANGVAYLYINGTRGNLDGYNNTATGLTGIWVNATIPTGELSTIELWRNGTLFQNGSDPVENNSELPLGYYNFTAKLSESQNYSGDTETWWVNISISPTDSYPTWSNLINHTQQANQSFTYNLNANDDNGISSIWLNDTTSFSINQSGYIQNSTALGIERIFWLIGYANDTVNNTISGLFYINITTQIFSTTTNFSINRMLLAWDNENTILSDMRFSFANEN